MQAMDIEGQAEPPQRSILGKRRREPEPQQYYKNEPGLFPFERGVLIDVKIDDGSWVSGSIAIVKDTEIFVHIPRRDNRWFKKESNNLAPTGTHTTPSI
eukprot:1091202_1